MEPSIRSSALVVALMVLPLWVPVRQQTDQPTVGGLLDAYWQGQWDVVSMRVGTGTAAAELLPSLRAWRVSPGASMWREAGLVLTVDLARAALTHPSPAPEAVPDFIAVGLDDVLDERERERRGEGTTLSPAFVQTWLELAIALEVAAGHHARALDTISRAREKGVDMSAALWLLRGLANEVAGDRDPDRALDRAVDDYDRAARDPAVRAEASARAADALMRLTRHADAMRRLDAAGAGVEDVRVAAWLAHLRGEAARGLGQDDVAAASAALARELAPDADDPGLAFEDGDLGAISRDLDRLKAMLDTAETARRDAAASIFELLDEYERDDYAAVFDTLLSVGNVARLASEVRDAADGWVRAGAPSEAGRRQYVVALVALELARARGLSEAGHLLLEWACERLRAAPTPADFERRWMHAAASVMAGAVRPTIMEVHLLHAMPRFPDDPVLLLDRAVAAELSAGPDNRSSGGLRSPGRRLDLVRTRLRQAIGHAEIKAESAVRMGYTELRRGEPADALAHLDLAAESADPWVLYLAHLFRGRAFDKLDRPADAVRAYEAAVAIVPGAQTAEVALAAALARAGDYARAEEVAERALAGVDAVQDPWLSYGQGDYRNWPHIIAALRVAAR